MACIGVGGMGYNDTVGVNSENIYALCDVDDERAAKAYKKFPKAKRYKDFRVLLDQEKEIDAVTISTPDHTHAVAAIIGHEDGQACLCAETADSHSSRGSKTCRNGQGNESSNTDG